MSQSDFNPRTPCGVRPQGQHKFYPKFRFQSTHPVRGATHRKRQNRWIQMISIHAPRAGCDGKKAIHKLCCKNFNPRTPCGVRRRGRAQSRSPALFQSPHPVRGATKLDMKRFPIFKISIHAPRAGCDALKIAVNGQSKHFNPRTPCGVRLVKPAKPQNPH